MRPTSLSFPRLTGVQRHVFRHGGAMAEHQVVDDHRLVPSCDQLAYTMTADVTGPPDDENVHVEEACIAFGEGVG